MPTKKDLIIAIIGNFEKGDISGAQAVSQIQKLSHNVVTEDALKNYWHSTNIDNFVDCLIVEPISNWKTIDDDQALGLIKEILSDINNDTIIKRNSEALEKRYRKASGSLSDWIFYDDITVSKDLLLKLKDGTDIVL